MVPSITVTLREGSFALALFGRTRNVHDSPFSLSAGRNSFALKRIEVLVICLVSFIESLNRQRFHLPSHLHAFLHISVCSFDWLPKGRGLDVMFGPEFNMAHELAITLQHTIRVGNLSAPKEPDIDVSFEHVDVAECRITYTRSRMTVMQ